MKTIFYFFSFFILVLPVSAQEVWEVPAADKSKLSPITFTEDTQKMGEDVFSRNCKSCHGNPGKADFIALVPSPGDPAAEKFQKNMDGEFFYKVRTGRGSMPSFKSILTTTEVWQVISYLRSFNSNYVQEVEKVIERTGFDGGEITINLSPQHEGAKIEATVMGDKEGVLVPIPGAAVKLYAKRQFGNLPVDEEQTTNEEGIAIFSSPKELPGDSAGNVVLLASLSNEEMYGIVTKEQTLEIGVPTSKPSLLAKRAMWNKMKMAPIWLLIAYFGVVLTVWGCIFYVVLQVRKIFLIGKEDELGSLEAN